MAQRIPRDESLSRVHGVGALFAAAYGNVGSSIYYALGVTAAFALGLTPVAFVISGLIFACTAATYAEATVMYPEAGGSSSFARHAFNELVSFIAAWGQMLNYMITVAISAYFVPHYLAVFWEPLGDGPGDIIGGAVLIAGLAAAQHPRHAGVGASSTWCWPIADLATQVVLVGIGVFLVLSPEMLVDNVHLGIAPTWSDFALGIAVGMIAYTGIETISNMAEEAKDVGAHDPAQRRPHGRRRARPLPADPGRRALGDAGHPGRRRQLHDRRWAPSSPTTRSSASSRTSAWAHGLTEVLRFYVGDPRRGDPADRHQRRPDRRLPAHLLDGPAPPAARAPAPGPPPLPHSLHRDPRLLGGRDDHPAPGPDRLPGDDVLVRRDALLHDRPRLGDPAATPRNPTRSGPGSRRSTSAPSASRCR